MFLVGQLLAQFSFPVLTGAIIRRAFGIGDLLCLRRLLGIRSQLGLGGLPGIGRAFRLRREVGLRRAARLRGALRLGFLGVRNALLFRRRCRLGLFRGLGLLRGLGVFCGFGILRRLGLFRGFSGCRRLRLFGSARACVPQIYPIRPLRLPDTRLQQSHHGRARISVRS